MSLEDARRLSIPDLLHVLNEKFDLECSSLRGDHIARVAASAYELESEIKCLETKAHDILEKFIPTVRSMWNVLRPANKLPQELFPHIARHLLTDENTVDAKPVIPMTHVCRYWRESIVSAPEIWTLISNSRSELMALTLARAKASRLDVSIDMDSLRAEHSCFGLITPYLENIRSLHVVKLKSIEELTRALPNFPQSTPNLRSMKLEGSYANVKWDPTIDPFGSLSRTVKTLSLFNVPLYPSILNLRSLTDLSLRYHSFDVHVDTVLTFLEHNRSLERVLLDIRFTEPTLRMSRRAAPAMTRIRHLSILCNNRMNAQALVSNIALKKGAHLEITSFDRNTGLNDILSDITTSHISSLFSPEFLEYQSFPRVIRSSGPNGSFSFSCNMSAGIPFEEFSLISLTHVREFRFNHCPPKRLRSSHNPPVFDPQSFPALETLAVECDLDLLILLSTLLSNPSALTSLKTLAFLNCAIAEDFTDKLAKYASDRARTTLAKLYHVIIVHEDGRFPSAASIHALEKHVPLVDVRFGTKLPADLA